MDSDVFLPVEYEIPGRRMVVSVLIHSSVDLICASKMKVTFLLSFVLLKTAPQPLNLSVWAFAAIAEIMIRQMN